MGLLYHHFAPTFELVGNNPILILHRIRSRLLGFAKGNGFLDLGTEVNPPGRSVDLTLIGNASKMAISELINVSS